MKVIDFPGHHRLREGLKKHLPQTSAIVFVLDANAKTSAFISDAEYVFIEEFMITFNSYLYNLFTSEFVNDTNIPFIIVCNKSDMLTARTKDDIKPILEKELYVSSSRLLSDSLGIKSGLPSSPCPAKKHRIVFTWVSKERIS